MSSSVPAPSELPVSAVPCVVPPPPGIKVVDTAVQGSLPPPPGIKVIDSAVHGVLPAPPGIQTLFPAAQGSLPPSPRVETVFPAAQDVVTPPQGIKVDDTAVHGSLPALSGIQIVESAVQGILPAPPGIQTLFAAASGIPPAPPGLQEVAVAAPGIPPAPPGLQEVAVAAPGIPSAPPGLQEVVAAVSAVSMAPPGIQIVESAVQGVLPAPPGIQTLFAAAPGIPPAPPGLQEVAVAAPAVSMAPTGIQMFVSAVQGFLPAPPALREVVVAAPGIPPAPPGLQEVAVAAPGIPPAPPGLQEVAVAAPGIPPAPPGLQEVAVAAPGIPPASPGVPVPDGSVPTTSRERKRAQKNADAERKRLKRMTESQEERSHRLESDAARASERRSQESQREADSRRQRDSARHAAERSEMTQEQQQEARSKHSKQVADGREALSVAQRDSMRLQDAERTSQMRSEESEDSRRSRMRLDARRARQRRSEVSDESEEAKTLRRQLNADRDARRRADESENVRAVRRERNAKRGAERRSEESVEAKRKRLEEDAVRTAEARAAESTVQTTARRSADRTRRAGRFTANLGIAGTDAVAAPHYFGKMEENCTFCGALYFKDELTTTKKFSKCCLQGSVKVPLFENFSQELKNLFTASDPDAIHFRENCRQYNNSLAMGSVKAKLDVPPGRGPYCYRVHGQMYHLFGDLHPAPGQQRQFAQVFIMDTARAAEELAGRQMNSSCREDMFTHLINIMERDNPFVQAYKMMREVEKEEELAAILERRPERTVKMTFRVRSDDDHRRYQLPTSSEVAVVYVGDEDQIPGERQITVHQRSGQLRSFRDTDKECDPMVYPLFFPTGAYGWYPYLKYDNPRLKRQNVSVREFYAFLLHVRPTFSPLFRGGKLFQQFVVDIWTKIEQNRLNFYRQNQDKLRRESLQELRDYVAGDETGPIGSRVYLPPSHTGSPRDMVQQFQDAMAVVARFGRPDYFLTMTCNPKWREIMECLEDGQYANDRPDVVARVFNLKLQELCHDLYKAKVLGDVAAHVHVVEFQKRGLPHAHMLIIMKSGSKPRTASDIDRIISSEIPDKDEKPENHELVTSLMMHRPCGVHNPMSPCMKDGKCSKKYPKDFQEASSVDQDGFAKSRRPDNGRTFRSGNVDLDNRHVVPHNLWLLNKYQCHINLEVCGTVSAVKYLYKYVYKGTTRASVRIQTDNAGNPKEIHDEIDTYLDTRYVCAPEAMHHLYGYKMSDRSVPVQQLHIHLPGAQGVMYEKGKEKEAVERAELKETTLTAWFAANKMCSDAVLPDGTFPPTITDSRNFYYYQMPEHFTYTAQGGWKPRRNNRSAIGRMYFVSPKDREKFALRQLLLYTKGSTSFDELMIVHGQKCDSFVEAAKKLGYLEDSQIYEQTLEEAAVFQSSSQLRGLFATLLCYGEVNMAEDLWQKFLTEFCSDYEHQGHPRDKAEARAYYDIYDRVEAMGVNLRDWIDLPYQRERDYGEEIDYDQCEKDGEDMRTKLTDEQEAVVEATLAALNGSGGHIFIDGPGGSGKTFTYNCIANIVQGMKKRILTIAWTGIAASLLPNGRTVASMFKLDINSGCRVSHLSPRSAAGRWLKNVDLILWDEAPMSPKASLETVDQALQLITDIKKPFGGKTVVLGGDFRQVLPVMDKGGVDEQVANCIKKSELWPHFKTYHLTSNMRLTNGNDMWRSELLEIGDGLRGEPRTGAMSVPLELMSSGDLTDEVFGDVLESGDVEELSKRAILTPRNKEALKMNISILQKIPGTVKVFKSLDRFEKKAMKISGIATTTVQSSSTT